MTATVSGVNAGGGSPARATASAHRWSVSASGSLRQQSEEGAPGVTRPHRGAGPHHQQGAGPHRGAGPHHQGAGPPPPPPSPYPQSPFRPRISARASRRRAPTEAELREEGGRARREAELRAMR